MDDVDQLQIPPFWDDYVDAIIARGLPDSYQSIRTFVSFVRSKKQ